MEFRQRIGMNFGTAVFLDAGNVSQNLSPFNGQLKTGAGVGLRYYTPIGPIRLDVAVPLQRRPGPVSTIPTMRSRSTSDWDRPSDAPLAENNRLERWRAAGADPVGDRHAPRSSAIPTAGGISSSA